MQNPPKIKGAMLPFLMTTCLTTKLYKEIEVVTQKSKQWREKVE